MNKIISGFIFYNEVDLLELRLEELYPVVDKFLLVQGDKTFRGEPKPLYFDIDDNRWDKYRDKILEFRIEFDYPSMGPWERETAQRNAIGEAARYYFEDADILIVSDADEIPRRSIVAGFRETFDRPVRLYTPTYYYGLNVRVGADEAIKAARLCDIDTAEKLRRGQPDETALIDKAGWHFSYLGDPDFIRNKIKSFSHAELDKPGILDGVESAMKDLRDPYGWGQQFTIEKVDETWPEAIKSNPERWSKFIW